MFMKCARARGAEISKLLASALYNKAAEECKGCKNINKCKPARTSSKEELKKLVESEV